ncbi:MAG: HlyD family efflux transporter periplasmic adaptor subunit [Clostridia bacterium]|nr:HlyD family efflux transporter periplasmic adaptor subunit [Clostridia bacterium]
MVKKEIQPMMETQKDDALFEALGQSKKRKKRRILITVTAIVLTLSVVAAVGIVFLQKQVRERFASSSGEVLSYEAATGTIRTVVSGSGTLSDVDLTTVSVPEGVEITEVLVKSNQALQKGDVLARADMASVISTMADLQEEIDALDKQISNAENDKADQSITAGVSGRIKAIFATADASVPEIMNTNGALALISLDGYMAVDLENDTLTAGNSVTVKRADGETVSGTVEEVTQGKATVLVSDNGPEYGEAVTVLSNDGAELGTGNLYIHSALRVTGYAGTVSKVHTSLNAKVSAATKLFTLKDTAYSANYNSLLRQRKEKEETLLFLLTVKRDGAVLAENAGSVYSVGSEEDENVIATLSNDEKMSVTVDVDESDILSLALGQEVSVTVSSVSEDAFSGTLTEIDRSLSSSGSYSAVIELSKEEGMLSGMTAEVSVVIEGVENAVLIPIEALHKTSDGAYVYTSYNEELQEYGGKVDVVTGIENSSYVEIKSGLNVGDTVYYTEETRSMGGMNGRPGMGGSGTSGGMGGFGGGAMPEFGGNRPGSNGNGSGTGNRPNFESRS